MQPSNWLTFDGFYISYVSHFQNTKADALAMIAATLALPADTSYCLTVATCHLFCPKFSLESSEVHTISTHFEPRDWRFPIIDYALHDILPDDSKEAAFIRQRSPHLYYDPKVKTFYRLSYDGILLRCLSNSKTHEVLKEAHDVKCGAHQPDPKLKGPMYKLGYYLPIMIANSVQ